jgi:hypothetical protein
LSVVPAEQADDVVGRVARTTLRPMDLLRSTDLFDAGRFSAAAATEVAVELRPAQALLGTIAVGDLVDVLSTDPDGQGTATVALAVRVSAVRGNGDDEGIGATGTVRVRLGVPDAATAEALVDASVRTELTLALPLPAPAAEAP